MLHRAISCLLLRKIIQNKKKSNNNNNNNKLNNAYGQVKQFKPQIIW